MGIAMLPVMPRTAAPVSLFVAVLVLATAACASGSEDTVVAPPDDVESGEEQPTDASGDDLLGDAEQRGADAESADSGDSGVSDEIAPGDRELCEALSAIVDLNDDVGAATQPLEAALATGGVDASIVDEAKAVADALVEGQRDVAAAYEVAIEAASGDRRADLVLLADTTVELLDPMVQVMRDATTVGDLAEIDVIFEDPEVVEAAVAGGRAALRIDEFAIPTCGFRFSNT